MKKTLWIALLALFLFGCSNREIHNGTEVASSDPVTSAAPSSVEDTADPEIDPATASPPRDKNGYIMITDRDTFELLRKYPDDRFHVAADIDFEGAEFEPVEGFSGTLNGVYGGVYNHTVSNVKIKVPEGASDAGFFTQLDGIVEHLNFRNVTMELPDGFSGNAGLLAGSARETVKDVQILSSELTGRVAGVRAGILAGKAKDLYSCFVSGAVRLELSGRDARIGTAAGFAENMDNVESEADLTLTGATEGLMAGGLAGELIKGAKVIYGGRVSVNVNDASPLIGGVVGKTEKIEIAYSSAKALEIVVNGGRMERPFTGNGENGVIRSAYRRDVSNLDETTLSEQEYELRKIVVDYMIREITIPWQPQHVMDYSDKHSPSGHAQHYEAYEWYFGLPYTHKCGSLERFQEYLVDGKMKDSVPRNGWDDYLGNDCADAVYWAWARISPSITYTVTKDMIVQNGTIQVGDYELVNHENTEDTCRENGIEVISEAYACLRMGDAVLCGPGHIRMVAEAPTVIRNADGTIDPDASYVLCHEQGSLSGQQERHTTCNYRRAITFAALFKGDYIPITIPEFSAGAAGEWIAAVDDPLEGTFDGVFYGHVTSNYRIDSVATVITKRDTGETVIDYRYYPNRGQHISEMNLVSFRYSARIPSLPAGDYHYVLYLRTGAGERVLEEYDFTKEEK
ncbi:MAG: hypothetical protein IKY02_05085 [Lachnospiraceae bacterium]|nr:hypothetical protein [Lachnospiraceae bacterium]